MKFTRYKGGTKEHEADTNDVKGSRSVAHRAMAERAQYGAGI